MAFKNFTVSLDENNIKGLKRIAFETGESQKSLVNKYLKEGIAKDKQDLEIND